MNIRQDNGQGVQDLLGRIALAEGQENGVVSGDGAHKGSHGITVQIQGHGGSESRLGANHATPDEALIASKALQVFAQEFGILGSNAS